MCALQSCDKAVAALALRGQLAAELDRFIVGQQAAKRAVAIALRERFRRMHLRPELRDEVVPKNILMIGPTGCGKTEIARRLAKLVQAPFVKVEATKYTEVGYHGQDVDAMIAFVPARSLCAACSHADAICVQRSGGGIYPAVAQEVAGFAPPQSGGTHGVHHPGPSHWTHGAQTTRDVRLRASTRAAHWRAAQTNPDTRSDWLKLLREGQLEDREVEVLVMDRPMPNCACVRCLPCGSARPPRRLR